MRQLQGWTLRERCLGSSEKARQNPEYHERKGPLWALSPDEGEVRAGIVDIKANQFSQEAGP